MTELETVVLDWLGNLLALPEAFLSQGRGGGCIQGSASEAQLVTLIAARELALRRLGQDAASKLVAYGSDQVSLGG
jgi:aromatic-L-amino-acid decarboxylase